MCHKVASLFCVASFDRLLISDICYQMAMSLVVNQRLCATGSYVSLMKRDSNSMISSVLLLYIDIENLRII